MYGILNIRFLFISFSKQQNDDEAERAQRRRTFGKSMVNTTQTSDSLVEEQQGLQNCLKIFHDNVSTFFFLHIFSPHNRLHCCLLDSLCLD